MPATTAASSDERFTVPLYTVTDAATYLELSRSTLDTWAYGYVRGRPGNPIIGEPIVTTLPARKRGYPTLSFGGLIEAFVLSAFRQAGVPLQRIRPSLDRLTEEFGPRALASRNLKTDGAEVLWEFSQQAGESASDAQVVAKALLVPRSGQYVYRPVVDRYLQNVSFDATGYASQLRLRRYKNAEVLIDPRRGFGRPIFAKGGARVEDVLGPLRAGDAIEDVAVDYGVPVSELRDAFSLGA